MNRAILTTIYCLGVMLAVHGVARAQADTTSRTALPVGNYRASDDSYMALFQAGLGPAFLHYRSGRLGILHPLDVDRYVAGPGAMAREPIEVRITLIRTPAGDVGALTYTESDGSSTRYEREPPLRTLDAAIMHDSMSLAVTLTLPRGRGPFPAIVMNHGGGPGVRSDLRLWTYFFTRLGYAVLTYDKRGSGETRGPAWQTFDDLAADAVAAVRWVKRHSAIDSTAVGMWAYSQSGWIAPLAARREPVRFLLAVSVPALSPAERAVASVRPLLVADGFSRDEADSAAGFVEAANAFGKGQMSWPDYQQRLNAGQRARWYDRVEKPTAEHAPSSPFYASMVGRYLDPLPYWAQVSAPVLAIYGALDTTVPAESSAPLLEQALADNSGAMVITLPNANHQMLRAKNGGDDELIHLNRYVAGYFDLCDGIFRMWQQGVARRPHRSDGGLKFTFDPPEQSRTTALEGGGWPGDSGRRRGRDGSPRRRGVLPPYVAWIN